ncbi:ABC transporter permease [Alicyclobacillus dauci]|uniref:ABC transporter permease n=1 Tax=Alicyclobacillus dauci TaxID=1475485 RepID=A0ABY6Z6S1_9BACL|nr:ABC transporter permease [Alicyclobacillus dauci]WAH38223.1 ABC transporter permease [Alicyclobacillus dauci]
MNACVAILKRSMVSLLRQRGNVIWMLVMPIIFSFVFGILPNLGGGSPLHVSVIDEDKSVVSRGFIQEMKQNPKYAVKVISPDEANDELRNFSADVIITLPHGLERQALSHHTLDIYSTISPNVGQSSSSTAPSDLQNQLKEWALAGNIALQKAEQHGHLSTASAEQAFTAGMNQAKAIHTPVQVTSSTLSGGKVQNHALTQQEHSVLGFAVMFIIFTLFGSTGTILEEKMRGSWSRLKTSPASQRSVMTGYGLSFVLIGWVQYALMILAGRLLFKINIPFNGWMALTVTLYIFAIAGFALCISGLVKTREQHMATGGFIASITSMIAGVYWPLDLEPNWMQHMSWFLPQGWALDAFQTAALSGVTLSALIWPLTVLAGFAVVFFSIGMVQLRYS